MEFPVKRIVMLSAAAVLAWSGAARADTITVAVTGLLSGNQVDSGDFFGGGSLAGETAVFSFSYDTDAWDYYSLPSGTQYLPLNNADGAVTASATIGSYTASLTTCQGCAWGFVGGVVDLLNLGSGVWRLGTIVNQMIPDGQEISIQIYGMSSTPPGGLLDGAAVQSLLNGPLSYADFTIASDTNGIYTAEELYLDPVTDLATPEPSAWGLVALGLGCAAFLKRKRCAKR